MTAPSALLSVVVAAVADRILDWVAGLGGAVLVPVTAALGFGESALGADLVVPGEVGMVIAGAAAARTDVTPAVLAAAGAIGAIAGDSTSFAVGRRWGRPVLERYPRIARRARPQLDRAEDAFERHGGRLVFGARWVGALRAVVPFVAGTARMSYWRFLAWDAPAAVLWCAVMVSLGYLLGDEVASFVDRFSLGLSVAVVAALVAVLAVKRLRRRGEPTPSGPAHR